MRSFGQWWLRIIRLLGPVSTVFAGAVASADSEAPLLHAIEQYTPITLLRYFTLWEVAASAPSSTLCRRQQTP